MESYPIIIDDEDSSRPDGFATLPQEIVENILGQSTSLDEIIQRQGDTYVTTGYQFQY